MKKYSIKVNGTIFDVEVEEVKESSSSAVSGESGGSFAAVAAQAEEYSGNEKERRERGAEHSAPAQRARTPKTPKIKEPQAKPCDSLPERQSPLCSPMPGTVLKICVEQGEEVYAGETLILLEAMKMENEINAHKTGRIRTIQVKEGDSVNTGDLLLTIE